MLYNIVKTIKSLDSHVCYFLYKHNIQMEDDSADTYGIGASDIFESSSLNDVLTDMNSAVKLLGIIANKSVSVNSLSEFIESYLDEM